MRVSLKKWAENEFKNDSQLNLIPTLYQKLKSEGYEFTDISTPPVKSQPVLSKDPNVVSSQQEEDDIAKAIELSLKEKDTGGSKSHAAASYVSHQNITKDPFNRSHLFYFYAAFALSFNVNEW